MRAVIIASLLSLYAASAATAALPPQYQRQVELSAIIGNEAIVEAFGIGAPIESISWISDDLYRVTGGACSMDVTIVDAPTKHEAGWAGPREFAVKPGEIACK
jgi:hypothetical protein